MFSILFVDDDENILRSLKRIFHSYRKEYTTFFANSGENGLDILEDEDIDFVISDMKMPEMDGAEFLKRVAKKYPKTVRVILTGQMDVDQAYKVVKNTHQFLAKPIDKDKIVAVIKRCEYLYKLIDKVHISDILNKIDVIPSLPKIYYQVVSMINDPDSSLESIAEVIETDSAMSLKILQLVNSAFFGSGEDITSVKVAVRYIGMNILKDLVTMLNVFEAFEDSDEQVKSIFNKIYNHSINVASIMKLLGEKLGFSKKEVDELFTVGIIHDIGKIVLLINFPDEFLNLIESSNSENIDIMDLEKDFFGTTHYMVSAYIMGIWGLSEKIVEIFISLTSQMSFEQPSIKNILYFANRYEKINIGDDIKYYIKDSGLDENNEMIKQYIDIVQKYWRKG